MEQYQDNYLPLTVKVVRECATKTLLTHKAFVNERLRRLVEKQNAEIDTYNKSLLTRLFNRQLKIPAFVEPTIDSWKAQFLLDKMPIDHSAYDTLLIYRTGWWKRLTLESKLPQSDDEKIMMVSSSGLDLIDYNIWC